jgi:hypothetical protein
MGDDFVETFSRGVSRELKTKMKVKMPELEAQGNLN